MPHAKTPPNLMVQLPSGKSPDPIAEQEEMHKFTGGDAVLESQEKIPLIAAASAYARQNHRTPASSPSPQLATGTQLLPVGEAPTLHRRRPWPAPRLAPQLNRRPAVFVCYLC
jgi:hypothetical protein